VRGSALSRRRLLIAGLAAAGIALCVVAFATGGRARPVASSPRPRRLPAVEHLITVSRFSAQHDAVSAGIGFRTIGSFPTGYRARDTRGGRGPSFYLAMNRDHYEEDWLTADATRVHWRSSAFEGGRVTRLLHDSAFGPEYEEWYTPATHRLHSRRHPARDPGRQTPASVVDAFRAQLRDGQLRRAGTRRVDGAPVELFVPRTKRRTSTTSWLVPRGSSVPRELVFTDRRVFEGRRLTVRQRIRILTYELVPWRSAALHLHVRVRAAH